MQQHCLQGRQQQGEAAPGVAATQNMAPAGRATMGDPTWRQQHCEGWSFLGMALWEMAPGGSSAVGELCHTCGGYTCEEYTCRGHTVGDTAVGDTPVGDILWGTL